MNIKRAFKSINKRCKHNFASRPYYQTLGIYTLVSDSTFVISVPTTLFEENKQYIDNIKEIDTLSKVFNNNDNLQVHHKDSSIARQTTVKILCGEKITTVFKSRNDKKLCVIDDDILKIVEDTKEYNDIGLLYFENTEGDTIRVPLKNAIYDLNDNLVKGVALLPIVCDVRGTLEHVLND